MASSLDVNGGLAPMAPSVKKTSQEEAEDRAARSSRENQLLVIYLFVATIIIASYVLGYFGFSFVWAFLLIVLAFFVWWNKVLALTEHFIRQKELVLHRRRAMRHNETTEWLNFIINRWWMFSSTSIADLIKHKLNPMLDQVKPNFLEGIEVQSFTVGESTPFIKYIQVFENSVDKTGVKVKSSPFTNFSFPQRIAQKLNAMQHYQVVIEADVGLQCDEFTMIFRTKLGAKMMGMTLDIAVEKLNISGKMQLLLNCDKNTAFPHVSSFTLSFVEKPEVWFAIRMLKAVQMMEIPVLKSWIHHLVMDGLTDALVDPGKIDVHLESSGPSNTPATASSDATAQGVLTVTIQGEQLKGGTFLDDVRYCQLRMGDQRKHTQYLQQGSAAWQDCCSFLVDNLKTDRLNLKWKSKVLFSTHTLAQFSVALTNFPFEYQPIQNTALEEKLSVAQGGGSIKLGLVMEYTPLSPINEEMKAPQITSSPDHDVVSGVLYIAVHSANNLKGLDHGGVSDPYCMVYCNGKKVRTTHYVCRTRNPMWEASMEILVPDFTKAMLSFIVYDWDGSNASEDDFLGSAHLLLTHLNPSAVHKRLALGQNLLNQGQLESSNLGYIDVTVLFRPVSSLYKSETGVASVVSTPPQKTSFINSAMARLSLRGEKKTSVSEDITSLLAKGHGILELKIVQARNLVAMDSNGFSDPYCSVKINGERKFTTTVKKKTLNPVWDEDVTLQLPHADEMLELRLYDKDVFTQNDFLGYVSLTLDQLKKHSNTGDCWFKLQDINSGEVQLSIKVILGDSLEVHDGGLKVVEQVPAESAKTSNLSLQSNHSLMNGKTPTTETSIINGNKSDASLSAKPLSRTSDYMEDSSSGAVSAKPSRKSYGQKIPLRRTTSDNNIKRGSMRKRGSTSQSATLDRGSMLGNYNSSTDSISVISVNMAVEMYNDVKGSVLQLRGIDRDRGLVYCKIRMNQRSSRKKRSVSRGRVISKSQLFDPFSSSPINFSFSVDHGLGIQKEVLLIFDVKSSSKKHIATRGYLLQDIFGDKSSVTTWLPLIHDVEIQVHLQHSGSPHSVSSPTQRKSFLASILTPNKKKTV